MNERVERLARGFDRGMPKNKAAPKNMAMGKAQGWVREDEPLALIPGTGLALGTAPRTQSPDDAGKPRARNSDGEIADDDMAEAEVSAYKQTRALYTQNIMLSG